LRDRAAARDAGQTGPCDQAELQDVTPGRARRHLDAGRSKAWWLSHDANSFGIM